MEPTVFTTDKRPAAVFQIGDSVMVLLITFLVATFFAVLLCFFPGKAFLGANFWPVIALPGLLAIGCGIKLLIRKPIVQINSTGIQFFRSGIFIPWQRLQSAQVLTVDNDDDESRDYLVVKYLNEAKTEIIQVDFVLTAAMNKTAAQLAAAIQYFRK